MHCRNRLAIINAGVGVFYVQRVLPDTEQDKWPMVLAIAGCVFAGFLVIVTAGLARELIHAVFDIADCALLDRKTPGAGDNPFTT